MNIYGRDKEVKKLNDLVKLSESSLLGITGRRRIGKTYLIDTVYRKYLVFSMTGIKDGSMEQQLLHFTEKLNAQLKRPLLSVPNNWQEAFLLLKKYLKGLKTKKKQVIFFDELPWLTTPRSGFLQMLAHLWNDYLSKEKKYILVVCGSSTSWITRKVYNDKGGLHNRVTAKINLQPFSLKETEEYLKSKGIQLTKNAISELYMVCGGVPYYLNEIKRGDSPTTAIERMCFTKDGLLYLEYDNLFKSLYENAKDHEAVIKALASSQQGLSRKEIIAKSKVDAGGPFTRTIEDLMLSGFIDESTPYGKKKRGTVYRLMDEYCIFYHRFIRQNKNLSKGLWQKLSTKQTYKVWRGYAFENLCFRQIEEIKKALGISAVFTTVASFRKDGNKKNVGFQIDLIIDRADQVINLCECKYYNDNYSITKKYAEQLRKRKQQFISESKTKKTVFTTLITNYPLEENMHSKDVVDAKLVLEELF